MSNLSRGAVLLLFSIFLISLPAFAQYGERKLLISSIPNEELEATVDLNQDGYEDLIVFRPDQSLVPTIENRYTGSHYVRYNDGTGKFSDEQLIKVDGTEWTRIVPADLNNDGRLDLAVYQKDKQKIVWLRNEGAGSEFSWRFDILTDINLFFIDHQDSFIFQDINQDEMPDFLCGCSSSWYKNDGQGEFTESFTISNDIGQILFATDLDQNDATDVVAFEELNGIVRYEYQADDTWAKEQLVADDELYFYLTERRARPFDMDNDGDLDMVYYGIEWGNDRGEFYLFENTADGFVADGDNPMNIKGDAINFELIDFDKDGFTDIVGGSKFTSGYDLDYPGSDYTYWYKNQSGSFSFEKIAEQQYALDIGQYNQSGAWNILSWNPNGIYLLSQAGSGYNAQSLIPLTGAGPLYNLQSADINGDDAPDFLFTSEGDRLVNSYNASDYIGVLLSSASGEY